MQVDLTEFDVQNKNKIRSNPPQYSKHKFQELQLRWLPHNLHTQTQRLGLNLDNIRCENKLVCFKQRNNNVSERLCLIHCNCGFFFSFRFIEKVI